MEKEQLEIVLEEVLEESRSMRGAVEELKQHIWQLKEEAEGFEKKLDGIKVVAPPVDTGPVQGIIKIGLERVQQLVAEQPKTVVHQRRFLLFPEYHATEYYRVIFRLIMWLTVASVFYHLFTLGKQALQNSKEVKFRELELTHSGSAVRSLYDSQQSEPGKQKMGKSSNDIQMPKGR